MSDSDTTNNLSEYRLNKAKELGEEAKLLFENKRYDGCVNRSYYAIFSAVRSILALVELDSRKHSGVIGYFDRYFVKTGLFDKEFSKIVHNSFNVRQASDYQDFYIISADQAETQLEGCIKFITEVEQIQTLLLNGTRKLPDIT
ncbi:MAG: HEPN domain-containing protein [Candidatus Electrothrix sp. ATG1]|nr:HEPN domain-containing protein [Candidatus Electrothrix sp. ATG1]MCI5210086.1 HEPN domain-containing protein [Candidatus Electrothrix sp. ATG2]